ncbi:MAG TPA: UvrD-helicase domain-containing protein [Vicinamibacterales bacterium]|nr:UvrD-helicase domain-containing protein [Vicinamibacterales bacterium]
MSDVTQLSLFGAAGQTAAADPALDADSASRQFAADPSENVVLEASAGTGKTTVLVTRYVNLLSRGVDPANILAITFTRKAAAEMRERIVRDLRRAADQSAFDRGRWLALRERLGDIQISTIDAFCLSLLREFPLEADLDPGFSLADETEVPRLIEQALDRALAIFVARAKREADIALVIAQLGIARAREGLAHLLGRRLVAWDVLDRFLARGPADLTADGICAAALASIDDLCRAFDGGVDRFTATGPLAHPRFQLLVRDLRRRSEVQPRDHAAVRGLLDRIGAHFLGNDGKARTSPMRITPYVVADYPSAEAGRRHREDVVRLSGRVEQMVFAFKRDLNAVLARGVRQMFSIAAAEYRRALNERSVLDYSDVLEKAVDLLRRMDEFSQSRFRLEGRFHHVLVDEFQDTSRKQWELISLLVRAWGEGQGLAAHPSIFIVGDRKQSIYRFRDAEVSVLREAGEFVASLRPGGNPRRSISRSFRAVPELLSFVNDVFSAIGVDSGHSDDFTYGPTDRFPIPDVADPRGPALGMSAAADPESAAAAVASEIARILSEDSVRDKQTGVARPVRPGDIGILFRSRASHREFEDALDRRGVPTYVYKGLGFFDADEIKDTSALIRYLANPHSELRAAAFLRSRFVGISDEGLARLAPHLCASLLHQEVPERVHSLAAADRAALDCARAHVPGWLRGVDRVPPADLLETILPASAYAYELRGPRRDQAWENLKKMRGLIRRIQNRGYATLARIADHLDSLTAGDESNASLEALDAVNLMTVHAAKGLEFPIVFVVNIGKGASGPPKPIRASGRDVSVGPFVSDTDEAERAREREETKRLLYVAFTRARDRLYLSTVLKDDQFVTGPGSLGAVLPDSLKPLFALCASGSQDDLTWTGSSGRQYRFRQWRPQDYQIQPSTRNPAAPDRFGPIADAAADQRVEVTGGDLVAAAASDAAEQTIYGATYSFRDPGRPERLVRGRFDRLVRRSDGAIVVTTFAGRTPGDADRERHELSLAAARELFPSVRVDGVLMPSP